jgi:hypothetical protein
MSGKGLIIPMLGTILVVVSIVLLAFVGSIGSDFEVSSVQRGGLAMSVDNHVQFWTKAFDSSIEFIAKRAAYDLGKIGGLYDNKEPGVWDVNQPTFDDLKANLAGMIYKRAPYGTIKYDKTLSWDQGTININYQSTDCGPVETSKCFYVEGLKDFYVSEDLIKSNFTFKPYTFNVKTSSNYIRLISSGRSLFDDPALNNLMLVSKNMVTLKTAFSAKFSGLTLETKVLPDNLVEFTISDKSCIWTHDYYCMAPLKYGETWTLYAQNGLPLPFDYLKLKFRVNIENPTDVIPQKVTYTFNVKPASAGQVCVYTASNPPQCFSNSKVMSLDYGEYISMSATPAGLNVFVNFTKRYGSTVTSDTNNPPAPFEANYDGAVVDTYFTCISDCAGKACGAADGCGGTCLSGTCPSGQSCISGTCVPNACVPNCGGKACGAADGCGGTCLSGTCPTNQHCVSGTCIPNSCVPNCAGKQCGPDGCGGDCGSCGTNTITCTSTCTMSTGFEHSPSTTIASCSKTCNSVGACVNCVPSCSYTDKKCMFWSSLLS